MSSVPEQRPAPEYAQRAFLLLLPSTVKAHIPSMSFCSYRGGLKDRRTALGSGSTSARRSPTLTGLPPESMRRRDSCAHRASKPEAAVVCKGGPCRQYMPDASGSTRGQGTLIKLRQHQA